MTDAAVRAIILPLLKLEGILEDEYVDCIDFDRLRIKRDGTVNISKDFAAQARK